MAEQSKHPDPFPQFLSSILDQLACPACFSALKLDETGLQCTGCGRVYPIVDGIPVLIAGDEQENHG